MKRTAKLLPMADRSTQSGSRQQWPDMPGLPERPNTHSPGGLSKASGAPFSLRLAVSFLLTAPPESIIDVEAQTTGRVGEISPPNADIDLHVQATSRAAITTPHAAPVVQLAVPEAHYIGNAAQMDMMDDLLAEEPLFLGQGSVEMMEVDHQTDALLPAAFPFLEQTSTGVMGTLHLTDHVPPVDSSSLGQGSMEIVLSPVAHSPPCSPISPRFFQRFLDQGRVS